MKKSHQSTLLISLLSAFAISLSACGDQKITQQVTIDKSLLEVLQGKGNGTPTTNPSGKPSPSPSADASVSPTPTPKPRSSSISNSEQELFDVIRANGNALNNRNLEAYKATLHPDSQIMNYMPDVFYVLVNFQTRYSFNDMFVDSQTDSTASVFVDRSTSDLSGTIQQNIVYELRKSGSDWKIFALKDSNG